MTDAPRATPDAPGASPTPAPTAAGGTPATDPFTHGRALLAASPDAALLQTRWDRWGHDLIAGLAPVYDVDAILPRVIDVILAAHDARTTQLRQRDLERTYQPDWYQQPSMIGYAMYTDRFAGTLAGGGTAPSAPGAPSAAGAPCGSAGISGSAAGAAGGIMGAMGIIIGAMGAIIGPIGAIIAPMGAVI